MRQRETTPIRVRHAEVAVRYPVAQALLVSALLVSAAESCHHEAANPRPAGQAPEGHTPDDLVVADGWTGGDSTPAPVEAPPADVVGSCADCVPTVPGPGGDGGGPPDDPACQADEIVSLGPLQRVSSCAEAQAAITDVAPGEIIELANGTYDDCALTIRPLDGTADGNETEPITLRAQTSCGTGSCGVTLHGNKTRIYLASSYWIIEGMKYEDIIVPRGSALFLMDGGTHNIFRHNVVADVSNANTNHPTVLFTNGADNNVLERNSFLGATCWDADLGRKGAYYIMLHNGVSRLNVIRHNLFQDIECGHVIAPGASRVEDLSLTITSNLFQDNKSVLHIKANGTTFSHNTLIGGRGTDVRGGSDNAFIGNWYLGSGGIALRGPGPGLVLNNYLEHTVSLSNHGAITLGWGNVEPPGRATNTAYAARGYLIANNTVVGGLETDKGISLDYNRLLEWPSGSGEIRDIPPTGNTLLNNLVVVSTGVGLREAGAVDNAHDSNMTWALEGAKAIDDPVDGWRVADPLLVDQGVGAQPRWRLPSGASPAKDGGASHAEGALDIFGAARGAPPDVGAEEHGASAMPHYRALTPDDVGASSIYIPECP